MEPLAFSGLELQVVFVDVIGSMLTPSPSSRLLLASVLGSVLGDAFDLERERQTLRLVTGADVTDFVLEHYDSLPAQWRDLIPLRTVLVVDRDPQAG